MKATNTVKPRRYDDVAVLFCDIVSFTSYCDRNPPEKVVAHLQELVKHFEELAITYSIQKIKTIGDAFMAVAGLLEKVENPVYNCVLLGRDMIKATVRVEPCWRVRVGIHRGPVIAGIIGDRQYLFDVWGDTVNTAQRVEQKAHENGVFVSKAAWETIRDICPGTSAGLIELKGKGKIEIYDVSAQD
ncbi:adenylate/guanylate cyclase domain-containing protein [bacterium]|nr:adenylate/guanylate cyclase domain-containing protein [bacterium]